MPLGRGIKAIADVMLDAVKKPGIKAYHGSPHSFEPSLRIRNKNTGDERIVSRFSWDNPNSPYKGTGHELDPNIRDQFEVIKDNPQGAFSMENIGTGEGAQAYGHGLYAADAIDTSKTYIPRDPGNEEWLYSQYKKAEAVDNYTEMEMWERAMTHDTPWEIRELYAGADYDDATREAAEMVASKMEANPPTTGHMYEVNIDVDPEALIDWDKPLSHQAPGVQERLRGMGLDESASAIRAADELELLADNDAALSEMGDELREVLAQYSRDPTNPAVRSRINEAYSGYTGELDNGDVVPYLDYLENKFSGADGDDFRTLLGANSAGGAEAATRNMRDAGIPGIRYLDQMSRDAGEGSSNYVIFDDSLMSIARKYGMVPGAVGAGALAAGGQSSKAEAAQYGEMLAPESPMLTKAGEWLHKIDTPIGNPLEGIADYLLSLGYGGLNARNKYSEVQQPNYAETAKRMGWAGLDVL